LKEFCQTTLRKLQHNSSAIKRQAASSPVFLSHAARDENRGFVPSSQSAALVSRDRAGGPANEVEKCASPKVFPVASGSRPD
jgi:hypothetical protein